MASTNDFGIGVMMRSVSCFSMRPQSKVFVKVCQVAIDILSAEN